MDTPENKNASSIVKEMTPVGLLTHVAQLLNTAAESEDKPTREKALAELVPICEELLEEWEDLTTIKRLMMKRGFWGNDGLVKDKELVTV